MTRKGPLVTLVGGGALAAVLLVASVNAASGDDDEPDLAAGDATPTEAADGDADGDTAATEPPDEPEEDAEPVPYVGWVDGGGASVAVIITGDEATAYVCDGNTVEAWLDGPAVNGELVLEGEGGTLVGSYDDTSAEGETTVLGYDWTFEIDMVEAPEGLYQIADTVVGGAEVDGGWIVLPDGTQVGVANIDGEAGPAPELDPETGAVELNGEQVTADRVG